MTAANATIDSSGMVTKPNQEITVSNRAPLLARLDAFGNQAGNEQLMEHRDETASDGQRQGVADHLASKGNSRTADQRSGNMKMRWYQHSTQVGRCITSPKNRAPSVAPAATSQAVNTRIHELCWSRARAAVRDYQS